MAGAPPNNDGAAGLGSDTAAGNYFFLQQETTKNIGWAPPMLIGGMAHDVGSGRPKKNAAHCRSGGATGLKKKKCRDSREPLRTWHVTIRWKR